MTPVIPRHTLPTALRAATLAALLALAAAGSASAQAGARPKPAAAPPPDYSAPPGAPYTAIEVRVPTPMGHTLAGTLTLPAGASASHKVGAVVTITGSGPEERDEYIGIVGYRPFRQLADSLGRRGIAVLRMDDRGVGASTGTFKGATTADFAEDIRAGLAFLRTRPEIDASRLGLIGHSEGALIAPLVAAKEPTLRAMVLLAGIARPGLGTLQYQLKNNIMHDTSLTPAKRDAAIAHIPVLIDSLSAADPWMKYFLAYNPAATDSTVKTPVLILTGANDQQASPEQLPEMAAAFKAAGNADVTARLLPNLNHLSAYDTNGFPGGYVKLPTPVHMQADAVGLVVDWLAQRVGQ